MCSLDPVVAPKFFVRMNRIITRQYYSHAQDKRWGLEFTQGNAMDVVSIDHHHLAVLMGKMETKMTNRISGPLTSRDITLNVAVSSTGSNTFCWRIC